jgi:hypothetical protein
VALSESVKETFRTSEFRTLGFSDSVKLPKPIAAITYSRVRMSKHELAWAARAQYSTEVRDLRKLVRDEDQTPSPVASPQKHLIPNQ